MSLVNTILYIVAIVCAVWVIYDVLTKQKAMKQANKVIWIVAAIVFSIIRRSCTISSSRRKSKFFLFSFSLILQSHVYSKIM
ncbi:MAG: hypothetical protein V1735_06630 [Nanoarchaeota archaeon]